MLKEAELLAGGFTLGPVGSHIVSEVIQGALEADPDGYMSMAGPKWPLPSWRFPERNGTTNKFADWNHPIDRRRKTPAGMRRALAPFPAAPLRLKPFRPPSCKESWTVSFSDKEFIAMLEAAADFSDYRSGQYFCKRESEPAFRA